MSVRLLTGQNKMSLKTSTSTLGNCDGHTVRCSATPATATATATPKKIQKKIQTTIGTAIFGENHSRIIWMILYGNATAYKNNK